jgi:putative solute:sodium symporter small subunit
MTPPPSAEQRRRHWQATRRLSAVLLAAWCAVTCGVAFCARDFGPGGTAGSWGFWAAAQGAPLAYLALVWTYAWRMNRLDRQAGVVEPN